MDSANVFGDATGKGETPMKDEIAAVEAELKAMQARLAELKAKAEGASQAQEDSQVDSGTQQVRAEAWQEQSESQQPQSTDARVKSEPAASQDWESQSDSSRPQQAQEPRWSHQRPPQSYQQPSYAYQQQAYTYQPPVQPPYSQYQPYAQPIANSKDHVAAGLLAIFLGSLGIHKFYLGYNTSGFVMLALTILGSLFTFGIAAVAMAVVGIIEGIIYLVKSQTEFEQIYVFDKKEWF